MTNTFVGLSSNLATLPRRMSVLAGVLILFAAGLASAEGSYEDMINSRTQRNAGVTGQWFELNSNDWIFYEGEAASAYNMGAIRAGTKVEVLKWNKKMARVRLPDGRVVFVRNRLLTVSASPSSTEKQNLAAQTSLIGRQGLHGGSPYQRPSDSDLGSSIVSAPSAPADPARIPIPVPRPVTAATGVVAPKPAMDKIVVDANNVPLPAITDDGSTTIAPAIVVPAPSGTTAAAAVTPPPASVTRILPPELAAPATTEEQKQADRDVPPVKAAPPAAAKGETVKKIETAAASTGAATTKVQTEKADKPAAETPKVSKVDPVADPIAQITALPDGDKAPIPAERPSAEAQAADKKKATTAAATAPANGGKCDPTNQWQPPIHDKYRITECLAAGRDGGSRRHAGIDMAGKVSGMIGLPIYAAANGRVIQSGVRKGYGCIVVIKHDRCPDATGKLYSSRPCITRSAHLQYKFTKNKRGQTIATCDTIPVGTRVTPCTQIGKMAGSSSGGSNHHYPIHLHFELRDNSESVVFNPYHAFPALMSSPRLGSHPACSRVDNALAVHAGALNSGKISVHTKFSAQGRD